MKKFMFGGISTNSAKESGLRYIYEQEKNK